MKVIKLYIIIWLLICNVVKIGTVERVAQQTGRQILRKEQVSFRPWLSSEFWLKKVLTATMHLRDMSDMPLGVWSDSKSVRPLDCSFQNVSHKILKISE